MPQSPAEIYTLLSLPHSATRQFNRLLSSSTPLRSHYFAASDPADRRIGSGSGTLWLLDCFTESVGDKVADEARKIIIHAGGQSRRLPAYAASGKVFTPIPVMRWALGQDVDQSLLDLQLPLYSSILQSAPASLSTLVASGDVVLDLSEPVPAIPDADIVCLGFWADTSVAQRHGVFCIPRSAPDTLSHMLQKPSAAQLNDIAHSHFYLVDSGVWLLSQRAIDVLRHNATDSQGQLTFYDLYGTFGTALGSEPSAPTLKLPAHVESLSVAIVPLNNARFRHFGTTRELISSTLALQNKVADQRRLNALASRPNPALFVQNCHLQISLTEQNDKIWIENSFIGAKWHLTQANVVTGAPYNDWQITLNPGHCLDIVPVNLENASVVRPYGFDDTMSGHPSEAVFLGIPLQQWASERNISLSAIAGDCTDIQKLPLFPIAHDNDTLGLLARWMISEPQLTEGREAWLNASKLSANGIMEHADLTRLIDNRRKYLAEALPLMEHNRHKSVFYHLDLTHTASLYQKFSLTPPAPLSPAEAPLLTSVRNHMLRSQLFSNTSNDREQAEIESQEAFSIMRSGLIASHPAPTQLPQQSLLPDQIVWARSPVRIDLAGGWTDTPPYSMACGGSVVNLAIELNGQPPLQVFIKPSEQPHIILRSIDMGASETINTFSQLADFTGVGSPFAIPKAALALAGFLPDYCHKSFDSLTQQLEHFGCGIEITLLSAIPAGSGLGTSSILAATTLAAINDFCTLGWTSAQICSKVLILEQMLTTGGGWQDQYGGVMPGVKLLSTAPDFTQQPSISWLPDAIWTDQCTAPCHLLYYTGLTRTAKNILQQIVRNMVLNHRPTLHTLDAMKHHTIEMAEAIQQRDFTRFGNLLKHSWAQNMSLDRGTNPPAVQAIIESVADLCLGYKLPGAGGGGYLYMVAKDPEAARRIRNILESAKHAPGARFVNMTLSTTGLQVSRS